MTTAKSSLVSFWQDGKMLSCRGWFISILAYWVNLNLILIFLLSIGFFGHAGCNLEKTEKITQIEAAAKIDPEIILENEKINWKQAKNAKYSKYKVAFPEDGMIHAKGLFPLGNKSVRVNILEINTKLNTYLEIKPQTASDKKLNSRIKIHNIVSKTNAIAAVNGGYFKPQTGVPLGALVIDGEIITGPIYNRAAISINNDGSYSTGKSDIKFNLKNKKINIKIDNINQPRTLSTHSIIYTEKWGNTAPKPPKYGANAIISNGKITGVYIDPIQIPNKGYILSAPMKVIEKIKKERNLKLETIYPEYFKNSKHIISGGPFLIKNGEIYVDAKEEKLTNIVGRNPRTLMGYTKDSELILAIVDGRENKSVGMSLYEAAKFMQKLGCINAINLDGGSSSVMYLKGEITNKPAVSGGIPLSGIVSVNLNSPIASVDKNLSEM